MSFIKRVLEILFVATRLGITSFGGPIAHIGYFREEYVNRRGWLDENSYTDIVSLCQVLPGPTSSQVGIVVGMWRAGFIGGVIAWLGFTLPSAIVLMLFAVSVGSADSLSAYGWLHGLKIMAVAVVALAVWGMARTICTDRTRYTISVVSVIFILLIANQLTQIGVIVFGAIAGWLFLRHEVQYVQPNDRIMIPKTIAIASLVVFVSLLIFLPVARQLTTEPSLAIVDSFYRAGSLVFGGGHVVLPMLQSEVIEPGWVSQDIFLAGYGAAQAIPGPLFTFAAYLGSSMGQFKYPFVNGLMSLSAIYLPSFLLIVGVIPFWNDLRSMERFRGVLAGVNASVVGLLTAALYDPIWISAVRIPSDAAILVGLIFLLTVLKWPVWSVVSISAVVGEVVTRFV